MAYTVFAEHSHSDRSEVSMDIGPHRAMALVNRVRDADERERAAARALAEERGDDYVEPPPLTRDEINARVSALLRDQRTARP